MKVDNFFAELKRRNVYKVAVAYIVAGWALSQGIAQVFPVFDVPNWVIRLIVVLIIIGLPIALVLAWMFELTPQGIKRTETADAMPAAARQKKHTWIYVVVIAGVFSIGLFFLGRYTARNVSGVAELPAKSIAVLPFDNLSRDPDNAYFCEGVQEEILTRLAKVADPSGGSYYAASVNGEHLHPPLGQLLPALLLSIEGVGPLLVVKTPAGSAEALGSALDQQRWPEVIGCIAGDDTMLIITRSERARRALAIKLRGLGGTA